MCPQNEPREHGGHGNADRGAAICLIPGVLLQSTWMRAGWPSAGSALTHRLDAATDLHVAALGLSFGGCSKSDIISRYPGPAIQARSAMSRGSPGKKRRTVYDHMEQNPAPARTSDPSRSAGRRAKSIGAGIDRSRLTAIGLISSATTSTAPARAAANANMPLPVLTSTTR